MNIEFLKKFANTNNWELFRDILYEYKDNIENVNSDIVDGIVATNGELYVGKRFAGKLIDVIIGDIDKYTNKTIKKKSIIDNFN